MLTPITIITNPQQLQFIRTCVQFAIDNSTILCQEQDELDNPLGEIIVGMIGDTLDSEDPEQGVHSFID